MEAVIQLEGVTRKFADGTSPALDGVSAEIRDGIVTGLVGPDGAGKTTLIRIMAGLMGATSGKVRVLGHDPLEQGHELRLRVGYMPQKFGLYEDLTVAENLNLHADLRGVTGERRSRDFQRLLTFTDLERFVDRLAGKLSGGMKQKLGLACALLGTPELLLLDEPGVGVDPISRRELWKMVGNLVQEGLSVIWSTAYLDEAEQCEEVLLLNEGKLLFSGKPADLTGRMRDRCIKICGRTEHRRQMLARALKHPNVMDGAIQGICIRLVLRPGRETPAPGELGASADATIARSEPRFEDAFVDVLGGGPGSESALTKLSHEVAGKPGDVVVEALDLTRRFGNFVAADRIAFQVRRGEVFGLLGPNGAGKSTTFRMMCGLLPPTSGSAKVLGIDLRHSASQARQRLGYMAQKFSLYGDLTVQQNLEFFSGVYGVTGDSRRQSIANIVEAFRLEPFLSIKSRALPLGYKQRLGLACAVMHQPDILFLDEPTSGVDPVSRREFWNHINALVEKGVTVVVTTHFMEEAEYCDHMALIHRGRIIAAGTPDELKSLARSEHETDPTMEDAFINLVLAQDQKEVHQ